MALAASESSSYIDSFSAATSAKGNGQIRVDFGVHGTGLLDVLGATKIKVYENGYLVQTFYSTSVLYAPYLMGHNTWVFYGGVDYTGTAGNTYYAKADFTLAWNETIFKWGKNYTFDENKVLVK